MRLKKIVENDDTPQGRAFDVIMQVLIIVSIISFSLETLPDLEHAARRLLGYIEIITVIIFTLEYLLRILVADRKLDFIFSFSGIVDLLAILPFYITAGIDLRSLRALRLLRSLRIFKLFRYSQAIQRFHRAIIIAKEEMILFFFVTVILLYFAAIGIYYFENAAQPETFSSIFSSLWWAVATLTTVGYGDIYPITVGGRLFTFFVLMIGLGVVAVPAGLIASALTEARQLQDETSEIEKEFIGSNN
jgi:voltage-gated potassium channel